MLLTDADKKMFEVLAESELGNQISDYLQRFQSDFCDVRNIKEGESAESIKHLAGVIQKDLIDRIKLQTHPQEVEMGDYE